MGEAEKGFGRKRRRSVRWTAARRERFLAVLGETGNVAAAARDVGVDGRALQRRRRREPDFGRDWEAALDAAERRLAGVDSPFDTGEEDGRRDPFEVVRRGKSGRLQIVTVGKTRWSARVEDGFIARLRETGNVTEAARAIGFCANHAWTRRRQWPGFARRWEDALEESTIEVEFQLALYSNTIATARAKAKAKADAEEPGRPAPPADPEFALKFLKWREEKKAGRGRRGRGDLGPRPPTIEEVTEKIVQRVEAIKRHRARQAGK